MMQINQLPHFDDSINTTGCCPKFNPVGWDAQELHFNNKKFARVTTRSAMHVPLNVGSVFARVQGKNFFYTTCPKCAKAYGKNYVVGVAEVRER